MFETTQFIKPQIIKPQRYDLTVLRNRPVEARRQIRSALQRWQEACDAWLSVKCRDHNLKDYEAIHQAQTLKNNIDQAGYKLKQALLLANAP